MKYGIGGLTKDHEYVEAVEIICNYKGIDSSTFRWGIDNVFDDQSAAFAVLKELESRSSLRECCWHCYHEE